MFFNSFNKRYKQIGEGKGANIKKKKNTGHALQCLSAFPHASGENRKQLTKNHFLCNHLESCRKLY